MTIQSNLPEEHVTVYLDILGFSEYVAGCAKEPERVARISAILSGFGKAKEVIASNVLMPNNFQLSAFSDSIIVSVPLRGFQRDNINLQWASLRTAIGDLSFKLLEQGLPLRGGIALGWLSHQRNVVFGTGLTSAVDIEHGRAHYPRIIVDEQVVAIFGTDLLFRDKDGEWVLNIFGHAPSDEHLRSLAKVIERLLFEEWERTPRRHRVLMKYFWLANSYNGQIQPDFAQVKLPNGGTFEDLPAQQNEGI